jgi:P27 family predicted phage terminase small subunit
MARPGPAPKAVELKAIENRGHRPLGLNLDSTFRPETSMPSIPKGLSPGARKVWKRLGPELLRYNLMSVVFSDLFEDLCESVADVKELRHSLRQRQALLRSQGRDPAEAFEATTPNGMAVQHPRYQILKSERLMMYSLLAKFGLSPSEQARVTTTIRAQLKLFENPEDAPKKPPEAPRDSPRGFSEFV